MSEVKFTEGPWVRVPQNGGGDLIARRFETGNQMNPTGLRLIAFMMARGNSLKEDEANANLMVAAPETLAALETAQAALAMMIEPNSIEKTTLPVAFAQATEAEVKARAAIARARGDQS